MHPSCQGVLVADPAVGDIRANPDEDGAAWRRLRLPHEVVTRLGSGAERACLCGRSALASPKRFVCSPRAGRRGHCFGSPQPTRSPDHRSRVAQNGHRGHFSPSG
jgi:hypothetical protein